MSSFDGSVAITGMWACGVFVFFCFFFLKRTDCFTSSSTRCKLHGEGNGVGLWSVKCMRAQLPCVICRVFSTAPVLVFHTRPKNGLLLTSLIFQCACVRVCVWSVVLFPTTCGQGKVLVLIRAVLQELSSTHSHAFYCEHKNILFKKKSVIGSVLRNWTCRRGVFTSFRGVVFNWAVVRDDFIGHLKCDAAVLKIKRSVIPIVIEDNRPGTCSQTPQIGVFKAPRHGFIWFIPKQKRLAAPSVKSVTTW